MNLGEIEELFSKALDILTYYEKTYLQNKVFTLFLGNGEKIKYQLTPQSIPHLLGINLEVIKTLPNFSSENTYDLLEEVLENPYKLYNSIKEGHIKESQIFSKNIKEKLKGFKLNICSDAKTILNQTEFICKFNNELAWNVTDKSQKYDYIIINKFNDGKIGLLGLVENGSSYYPISNQLFNSVEECEKDFKELLTNQEITLITGCSIYSKFNDSTFNSSLSINQKVDKIDNLKYYKNKFNSIIDISQDYQYTINMLQSNKEERYENKNTIDEIINSITNSTIINRNNFEDTMLIKIIDAWNDHITSNSNNSDSNAISYTDAIKELGKMKNIVLNLEKELDELTDKNKTLNENNTLLENENNTNKEIINKVYELVKPKLN